MANIKILLIGLLLFNQSWAMTEEGASDTWFFPLFTGGSPLDNMHSMDTWELPNTEEPTIISTPIQTSQTPDPIQRNYGTGIAGGGIYGSQNSSLFGRSYTVTLVKRRDRIADWREQNTGLYTSAPEKPTNLQIDTPSLVTLPESPLSNRNQEVFNEFPEVYEPLPLISEKLPATNNTDEISSRAPYFIGRLQEASSNQNNSYGQNLSIPEDFWKQTQNKLRRHYYQKEDPIVYNQNQKPRTLSSPLLGGVHQEYYVLSLFLCLLILASIALEHRYHAIARFLQLHLKH
ncbi:MAG TPA: hypothetical protein VIT68_03405 [Candidatus Gracilibacteria bacterium]